MATDNFSDAGIANTQAELCVEEDQMKLWQIAAGDPGRDYTDLFLHYDLMLIGPGEPGEFSEPRYADVHKPMRDQIRSFKEKPQPGDLVLLRSSHDVRAVGRIPELDAGGYTWRAHFDDVLGWDLQHTRRVVWSEKAVGVLEDLQPVFGNYKQQRTFTGVKERRLIDRLQHLDAAVERRSLNDMSTDAAEPLNQEELGVELFQSGLPNDSVERVLASISLIGRLQHWYESSRSGARPSETETVAHMIVPLMLGLGWSEQLLAVEWKHVDLAFFDRTPTAEENCAIVCEAKTRGRALKDAYRQAKRYVQHHSLDRCLKIVATDGVLLLVYHRQSGEWPETPNGYVNLLKIRRANVYPWRTGGVDTLISLMPSRIHQ